MKRILGILTVLILVVGALAFLFRGPLGDWAFGQLTRNMFIAQDTDAFDPGPAIGSQFPGLRGTYQHNPVNLLEAFRGENGTVFTASRSVDWCPYCMRQVMQLQEYKAHFDEAGIGLVIMTYDDPEMQRAFAERHGITIPMLSDEDALSFKTLGILNEEFAPTDSRYGVPHPGSIIIDANNKVVGKLFIEDYAYRVDAAAVLDYASEVLGLE